MELKKIIKKNIEAISNIMGIEIHKKGLIKSSLKQVLNHLKEMNFVPKVVFDVGVGYGDNELYEAFPNSQHVLIEPLIEYRPWIDEIVKKYRAEYFCAAAGERNGTIEIKIKQRITGSSILEDLNNNYIEKRTVPVLRLDTLCKDKGYMGPYLIKADVQGYELKVLEGASAILDQTEVIIIEVSLYRSLIGGALFHEVINFMTHRGFCLYDLYGGIHRPLDNSLAQFDAVFVKEKGKFREDQRWSLKKVNNFRQK